MKSLSGKELAKLLGKNGWQLLRVQGSHHIFGSSGYRCRFMAISLSNEVFFTTYSKWLVSMQRLCND